jgi:hypothetical protein
VKQRSFWFLNNLSNVNMSTIRAWPSMLSTNPTPNSLVRNTSWSDMTSIWSSDSFMSFLDLYHWTFICNNDFLRELRTKPLIFAIQCPNSCLRNTSSCNLNLQLLKYIYSLCAFWDELELSFMITVLVDSFLIFFVDFLTSESNAFILSF